MQIVNEGSPSPKRQHFCVMWQYHFRRNNGTSAEWESMLWKSRPTFTVLNIQKYKVQSVQSSMWNSLYQIKYQSTVSYSCVKLLRLKHTYMHCLEYCKSLCLKFILWHYHNRNSLRLILGLTCGLNPIATDMVVQPKRCQPVASYYLELVWFGRFIFGFIAIQL